ncbi:tetratricopeptide repeat protein [Maridesulfovibrio bastinii]|uniref:tetratricopeptide repeat protein n=1 Tax=Maridesulfovibrio bastinii TaxID=47157 RepID=UPI0003F9D72E|nr:tetratricopeptide repeat protein [Maridesulfovibrio bastinii]
MAICNEWDKSPKLTNPLNKNALSLFTDRFSAIQTFFEALHAKPLPEKIIYFQGDGGNGKTLLLNYLKNNFCKILPADSLEYVRTLERDEFLENVANAENGAPVPCVLHDFGSAPAGEERPLESFSALLMLRRRLAQYNLLFPSFDYACLMYLKKTAALSDDKIKSLFPEEELNLIFDLAKLVKDLTKIENVLNVIKSLLALTDKFQKEKLTLYLKRRKLTEEQLNAMAYCDAESELLDMLPELLAKDINASFAADSTKRLALLFDTHEAFAGNYVAAHIKAQEITERDSWFRKLLGNLELSSGIIVAVAGRYMPQWSGLCESPIKDRYLKLQEISFFERADALDYLKAAADNYPELKDYLAAPELVETILEYCQARDSQDKTGIHPFYLGLCMEILLAGYNTGQSFKAENFKDEQSHISKSQEVVRRFMRSVDEETREVLFALSCCRSFNMEIYNALGKELNLNPRSQEFTKIKNFSFVYREQAETESYRIHDIMRHAIPHLASQNEDKKELLHHSHKFLKNYYTQKYEIEKSKTALAESIYHLNQYNNKLGCIKWSDTMDEANKKSDHELCRILIGIRNEMDCLSLFYKGLLANDAADFYLRISKYKEAEIELKASIEAYSEDLKTDPEKISTLCNKGNSLQSLGDLLATLSKNGEAIEKYNEAIESYDAALKLAPDQIVAHNNKGNSLQSLGNILATQSKNDEAIEKYNESIKSYDAALKLAPDYIYAHNNKGLSLQNLGDLLATQSKYDKAIEKYKQAIESYDAALKLAPDDIVAHNNKGNSLCKSGELLVNMGRNEEAINKFKEAIESYGAALKLAPDYIGAHNNKGNSLQSLGEALATLSKYNEAIEKFKQSIKSYDAAIKLAPDGPGIHNNKGNSLQRLGDLLAALSKNGEAIEKYKQSLESYHAALKIAPDYIYAHNDKGNSLQALGDVLVTQAKDEEAIEKYKQALESYDAALELAPDYINAHNNKGNSLQSLGNLLATLSKNGEAIEKYKQAIESYDAALKLAPDYIYAHNNKGNSLRNLGIVLAITDEKEEVITKLREAIECYDYALKFAPNHPLILGYKEETLNILNILIQ